MIKHICQNGKPHGSHWFDGAGSCFVTRVTSPVVMILRRGALAQIRCTYYWQTHCGVCVQYLYSTSMCVRIVARYSSTRCGLGYVNDMSVGIGLLSTTCSVKERSPVLAPGHLIISTIRWWIYIPVTIKRNLVSWYNNSYWLFLTF